MSMPVLGWDMAAADWPMREPGLPKRSRMRAFEVTFALVAPVLTIGLGGFAYLLFAAIRRNRWPLALYGFGYTIGGWTSLFLGDNPAPMDDIFYPLFFLFALAAMAHGLAVALSDDPPRSRRRREQARHFAQQYPDQARRSGVGRPDLARTFDDGGLVDLNHASDHELASVPGFGPQTGHRIAVDRVRRGLYTRAEDLVARGIIRPEDMSGAMSYLICLPPPGLAQPPPGFSQLSPHTPPPDLYQPSPQTPPPDFYQPSPHTPPGAYHVPVQPQAYQPPPPGPVPPDPEYPAPADPWSESGDLR